MSSWDDLSNFNSDRSGKPKKQRDIGDFWSYIDGVDYSGDFGGGEGGFGSDEFFDDTGMEAASSITDQNDLFGFNNTDENTYDFFHNQGVSDMEKRNANIMNGQLNRRVRDVNAGNAPMNAREGRTEPFNNNNPISYVNPNAVQRKIRSPEGLF